MTEHILSNTEIVELATREMSTFAPSELVNIFESCISELPPLDISKRKLRQWCDDNKDAISGLFYFALKKNEEIYNESNNLLKDNNFAYTPPPVVEKFNEQRQLLYYKTKMLLLEREFSHSCNFFGKILMNLIIQILNMHKHPVYLLNSDPKVFLQDLKEFHKQRIKGGQTQRTETAFKHKMDLIRFENIYKTKVELEEFKEHDKKAMHAALLEFCLQRGIIYRSARKEYSTLKNSQSSASLSVKDQILLSNLQQLIQKLRKKENNEAILFLEKTAALQEFKRKILRRVRQNLKTAQVKKQSQI